MTGQRKAECYLRHILMDFGGSMSRIKDFRITDNGIWIPKSELMRIRDEENQSDHAEVLAWEANDLIHLINVHYRNPKEHEDPKMMELAGELQQRLMQCTIDFFRENGVEDIWSVAWDADDLPSSIEEGMWIPYSDSSITMEKLTEDGRVPVAFVI